MPTPRFVVWTLAVGLIGLCTDGNCDPAYPSKPIRILAGGAGGGGDFVARLIAQGLAGSLGQPVVVDNRAPNIATEVAAKASADGYTLLFIGGSFWTLPLMRSNVNYDPVRDFLPVTLADRSPNILVVHPSVAANSVKELMALAKAKPGQLNYASGGLTTTPHLAAELFKAMAGVYMLHVPYKGVGPAINDLLGGQVQLIFTTAGSVASLLKSGRLRALAVTSAQPSILFPDLPTVAASGLPGYQAEATHSVFAPAKTPAAIVYRLNQESARFLQMAETKEKFLNAGLEAVGSSPRELAITMKSEMARMGKVIKDAGIRAE